MSSKIMRGLIVSGALVFVLGFMPASVFARDGESGDTSDSSGGSGSSDSSGSSNSGSGSQNSGEDENENQTTAADNENENETTGDTTGDLKDRLEQFKEQRQENKQHRLEANKLRVCELHKTKITAITSRSITRAERQLELFTKIADRVKAFYVKKGYNVANYNDLVAAADAAKAKAQTDLDTLKNLDAFDCNSDDPKGQAEAFKLALKAVNQDLKDYRTAVKNLIVAVKSANSQATDNQQEGEQQ